MARRIDDAGLSLIKAREGLRLTAYQDVAGIWTIGYGHIKGVTKGMTITADQADAFLRGDVAWAEQAVDAATDTETTSDNQFSAMVSLTFNIGAAAFGSSSVLRLHNNGDFAGAAAAFLMWDKSHVNGKLVVVQGLLNRRKAEAALYQTA